MKITLKNKTLLVFMVFTNMFVYSQSMKQKVADKYFDKLNYVSAVEVYEDIASGKNKDYHNLKRTAECYRLMNLTNNAEVWYKKVIDFGTNLPKDHYNYAQLLKSNGKYDASNTHMALFYEKAGKGTFTSTPNFYEKLKSDSSYYIITTLDFNSSQTEMSPVYYNNDLVFVSNRKNKNSIDKNVGWDNTNFLDVYSENGNNPTLFFGEDLTKNSHDGPISFDTINNQIFITRNNLSKEVNNKKLKLYILENSKNNWDKKTEFPYNNDDYSLGHSTLSPDGNTIYYASNMPGGQGETDIWKSTLENGKWSTPENLGDIINTFDNEMFPYISPDGDLYFASKGHQGFGGLDLFVAYKDGDGFMEPVNMGYPINTRFDDFSLIVIENNKIGYFASNRVGGKGLDDIYKVEIKKQIAKPVKAIIESEQDYFVSGNVFDIENNLQLIGAKIVLKNKTTGIADTLNLSETGFNHKLESNTDYEISFSEPNYTSKTVDFSTHTDNYEITLNESLNRLSISLNNIYYEFNSYKLTTESKTELNNLVDLLESYPNMKIQLNSHTDCVGDKKYNTNLSQRRAKSVLNYLVSKGIQNNRLTSKGYGESQPVNKCKDGVTCSQVEYQENRRTEFIILK